MKNRNELPIVRRIVSRLRIQGLPHAEKVRSIRTLSIVDKSRTGYWLKRLSREQEIAGSKYASLVTMEEAALFYCSSKRIEKAIECYNHIIAELDNQPNNVKLRFRHVMQQIAELYELIGFRSEAAWWFYKAATRLYAEGKRIEAADIMRKLILHYGNFEVTEKLVDMVCENKLF